MPSLKLIYFDFPARAEVARLLLKVGGVPFEDYRMKREEWAELKPTMPMGQVPVLEVDGKKLCQSSAIDRYCANIAGLVPSDAWVAAKSDELYFAFADAADLFRPTFAIKDEQEKLKARKELCEGPLKDKLQMISKLIESVPEGQFVGGAKPSVGDLALFNGLSMLVSGFYDGVPKDMLKDFPVLAAFHKRVASIPQISEYINTQANPIYGSYKA